VGISDEIGGGGQDTLKYCDYPVVGLLMLRFLFVFWMIYLYYIKFAKERL
jgi:hypothetical protein